MSYNLKTLIVFDTNALRSIEAGKVAYSFFSFGKAYNEISQFIKSKRIDTYVTLAVSTMVIDELKQQKQRQYREDIQQLQEIVKRLTGLPHIPEGCILIPEESFDCGAYIEEQANNYIQTNGINVLVYKDEHAPSMLKNMLSKVVGLDKPRSPFAITSKTYNDAGFKDSVIWETLMHYEKISDFDKIFFLTRDGDYKENCVSDFKDKWNKHIQIEKDENRVIAELERDYKNFIEYKQFYLYTEKEYFRKYLQQQLNEKTYIQLDEEYTIENYTIHNYCESVESRINEETQEEEFVIHSSIVIHLTRKGIKENISLNASIVINDVFEIAEITFEPYIY